MNKPSSLPSIAILVVIICVRHGFSQSDKDGYIVLSQKAIRPGLPFPVSILVQSQSSANQNELVTVRLKDEDGNNIQSKVVNIKVGSVASESLIVPNLLESGTYSLHVSGDSPVRFENATDLEFNPQQLSVFIQTDKAIYKPGEVIRIRAFAINPTNFKTAKEDFVIEAFDQKGNKVFKEEKGKSSSGVVSVDIPLAAELLLGDWLIRATTSDTNMQSEQVVEIGEYVLPRYNVSVVGPGYVHTSTNEITFTVSAEYTYGEPVIGFMEFEIMDSGGNNVFYNNKDTISGKREITVYRQDIVEHISSYRSTLLVRASLSESENGKVLSDEAYLIVTSVLHTVEFTAASENIFKPGLDHKVVLALKMPDGNQIRDGIEREISLKISFTDTENQNTVSIQTHTMPVQGTKTVLITEIPVDTTSIRIEASLVGDTHSYIAYHNPINAYSPSNNFLKIQSEKDKFIPGTYDFTIKTTELDVEVFYIIISRNGVVSSESGKGTTLTINSDIISIPIDSSMAPSSRLIVYYIRSDSEVVADSFPFTVTPLLNNYVNLEYKTERIEPGKSNTLDIESHPGSTVFILGVDLSVLLLATGNDITHQRVEHSISQFSPFSLGTSNHDYPDYGGDERIGIWPGPRQQGNSDTAAIINNNGLVSMTNLDIPRQFSYYRDYDYWLEDVAFMADGAPAPNERGNDGDTKAGESLKTPKRIRKWFPEAFIFEAVSVNEQGSATLSKVMPDTITSWATTAFAVSDDVGLGIVEGITLTETFRNFFITLNLPYSVVRGEQLVLEVRIFNYFNYMINALVTVQQSDKFDIINEVNISDVSAQLVIQAGSSHVVGFPMLLHTVGHIPITVTAQTTEIADAVERMLIVRPEGIRQSYSHSWLVDLPDSKVSKRATSEKDFDITVHESAVPDSSHIVVTAIGDIMGPSINNIDRLVTNPTGCGEQNMITFAPNVYVREYLTSNDELTQELDTKTLNHMKMGYQRELIYQRDDGSFSAFGNSDSSGSSWLSAFVMKVFSQSSPHITIDGALVANTIKWLNNYHEDGQFSEPGKVIHTDMQGGVGSDNSGIAITAYITIALIEVRDANLLSIDNDRQILNNMITSATTYLEGKINQADIYSLCVISYALAKQDSTHVGNVLQLLDDVAVETDGMKYWAVDNKKIAIPVWADTSHPHPPPPQEIEMAAYVLLTYAQLGDVDSGLPVLKWLSSQRNELGGYTNTQNTVIALEALAKFSAILSSTDTELTITAAVPGVDFSIFEITINNNNIGVLHSRDVTSFNTDTISIRVEGHGRALLQVVVMYNTLLEWVEPTYELDVSLDNTESDSKMRVKSCAKRINNNDEGMVVMDIGVPSGFKCVDCDVQNSVVKRIDVEKEAVILYLDGLVEEEMCLEFDIERESLVAGSQPASASVYTYYRPEERKQVIYSSTKLADMSACDICKTCGNMCGGSTTVTASQGLVAVTFLYLLIM